MFPYFIKNIVYYFVITIEDLGFILLANMNIYLLQLVSYYFKAYITVFQLFIRVDAVLVKLILIV